MNTATDFDDLEALYTASLIAAPARKSARTLAAATPALPTFAFPERWVRQRCIALIHGPSGTLLGNFALYHHDTVKGAVRYVREEGLTAVSGHEFVEGAWWLEEPSRPAGDKGKWTDIKTITSQAILPSLGLHTPAAKLRVRTYLGGITRIELAEETQFAGDGKTLVSLPADIDIRALLSLECKIAIRQEVLGFFDKEGV